MTEETHYSGLLAGTVLVATTAVLTVHLLSGPVVFITPDGSVLRTGRWTTGLVSLVGLLTAVGLMVCSAAYLLWADDISTGESKSTKEPDRRKKSQESTDDLLEARREDWSETADRLANTDQVVYEAVLEADGVLEQRAIVEHTDKSKATVSRALDRLEAKDLVERKRRGNRNVIILR